MLKYLRWIIKLIPTINELIFCNQKYSKKPSTHSRIIRTNHFRNISLNGMKSMDVILFTEGKENLINVPSYVLTPNHQSMYDVVPLMGTSVDPLSFIAKDSLLKAPFAGKAIKSVDGLFLERDNLRQEIKIMQKMVRLMKENNYKFVIFPEGTRTKKEDLSLNEFKPGSFKFIQKEGFPIIPVCIHGTNRLLDKKIKLRKYPLYISYLKPILKEEYENMTTLELSKEVEKRIALKLEEIKEKDKKVLQTLKK